MPEEKTKTPNIKVQNAKLGVFIIFFFSVLLLYCILVQPSCFYCSSVTPQYVHY